MNSPFHENPLAEAVFAPDKMGKATLVKGTEMMVGLNSFEPGQAHASHAHAGTDKLYVVLSGEGEFEVGSERRMLKAGAVVLAPASVPHGVRNTSSGRLIVLVAMAPPPREK